MPSVALHVLSVAAVLASLVSSANRLGADTVTAEASPKEVIQWFTGQDKIVLTFTGYSGAGYEQPQAMLADVKKLLATYDPQRTIVNIGATSSGIGAVYEVAKKMGFTTTGIVSTQAKKYEAEISPFVDRVFYIPDETWGGLLEGTNELSPTSRAMVESSDVLAGFGGGEVSRDEMLAAKRLGKKVQFFPADMDHQKAVDKARDKGLPTPTDFRGAAHIVFANSATTNQQEN